AVTPSEPQELKKILKRTAPPSSNDVRFIRTSDPLEDMLFSEVDEKAVSDLVGSLESQLAGQSNPAGKTDENGGTGSVPPANHHLGKTLPAPVGTTTLEQQQQGRRNKPEMRQEINSKDVSPDKNSSSPSPGCSPSFDEPSTTSAAGVNATSSGSLSHRASITTLTASAVSTLASTPTSPPRKRITTPRRSASARIKSLNGASVTTRRSSNAAMAENVTVSPVDTGTCAQNSSRAVTSSINTSTFTLSHANLPVGQSAIALDRGTPTIALHRLPSHIVASIAQNGNGTSVSALVQQGTCAGPITSSASQANHNKPSKIVMSSQSGSVNTVINTVPPAPSVVTPSPPPTTTAAAVTTTTVTQPLSSATAASCVTVVTVSSSCGTAQTTSVTTTLSMARPSAPSPTPAVASSAQSQPRPGLAAPQRIVAPQLIVRPPQQQTTIQLPPGFTIPPGMVLVRTELGQLVMVPQQTLAQVQAQAQAQAQNNISPRPATPTTGASFRVTGPVAPAVAVTAPQQTPVVMAPQAVAQAPSQPVQPPQSGIAAAPGAPIVSQEMQENVKKCKNFLATLIKLASHNSPSPETSKNVKALVQDLLDAKIEPEEFTSRLQTELKSSPQPYLVPFLKVCFILLYFPSLSSLSNFKTVSYTHCTSLLHLTRKRAVSGQVRMPVVITQSIRAQGTMTKGTIIQAGKSPVGLAVQISGNQKNKLNDPGGGSFRDDDDINDVASMAGVNLNEESARILATNSELVGTQIRSCKDEAFLHPGLLHRRILETAKKFGVTEVPMETVTFISHAAQSRLRTVVEKVSTIAQHRLDSCKDEECYEQSADVRSQLRFFEQLERIEKQRKDEQEREILLKAAKSRSRQEDPEQARLKQKAKEVNVTSLHLLTSPLSLQGSGSMASSLASSSALSSSSRQYTRHRITRVNLRDLIFYMEQERETAHSLLLYRALLK
uniref:TAFH domain-containing protein n=1 Tax=Mola mola TaxID=94237 RepID=A0A3Q3XFA0_MOLML